MMNQCSTSYEEAMAMLSCIGDGIIAINLKGCITYMNSSAEEYTGWAYKAALGESFEKIFYLVDTYTKEKVEAPIDTVVQARRAIGLTKRSAIYTKQGELRYVSANFSPILQEQIITGVIVVFRDITQLILMEDTLRAERNNFKTIFEALPHGKLIIDKDYRIRHINKASLKELDRDYNQVIGKSLGYGLDCPKLVESGCGAGSSCKFCENRKYVKQVFETESSVKEIIICNDSFRGETQKKKWSDRSYIPVMIEGELYVMVTDEDITKQKENEAALLRLNDFYLRLYENFPTFVWITDVENKISFMSNKFMEHTGVSMETIGLNPCLNHIHPEDKERILQIHRMAFVNKKPYDTEVRFINKKGEARWYQIYNRPYFNIEGLFDGYIGMGIDIHEKKIVEEELKRYQLLSQKSRDIIMFVNEDGSILDANEAAVNTYGYSRNELLKLSIYDIRKNRSITVNQMLKAQKSGIIFETIHHRKDGTSFPVEVSAQGTDFGGKPMLLSIVRDLTERKISEMKKYESERKYKMLFNKATDLIYLHELEEDKAVGKIIEVNNNACNTLGYSRKELIGKSILDINSESSKEIKNAVIEQVIEKGNLTYEATHRSKLGKEILLEINSHYFIMDQKRYILSVARDINDRKKTELQLQESEKRYQSLFKNLHSGFVYHKAILNEAEEIIDFEYVLYNDAYRDMFLKGQGNVVGKMLTDIIPNSKEQFIGKREIYEQVIKDGKSIFIDEEYKREYNKWYSIGYYSPEAGYLAIVITDIDDKKRSDLLLKDAKEQAEKASRTKSEFLANMSHEIRTPLNGIVGMIDITLLSDLDYEQKENLLTAKTCVGSLLNIINDILDFSKMEAGKLNINNINFNMKELLDEIIKAHSVRAKEKGLELLYTYASNISPYLIGDPNRLQQILNNLINNAIKFTDEGEVSIDIRKKVLSKETMELQFCVKDTGIGISKCNQKLLFKSFSQVDSSNTRKYSGTGLGLVISKQLIELMGGKIWVTSEMNQGSSFYFTIPYHAGSEPLLPIVAKPVTKPILKHFNLLIVEDDSVNQLVLSRMLKDKGYHIDLACNGLEALVYYQRNQYDLILMDIQMPEMDGVEATKQIRELEQKYHKKRTPIIALTAYALQGDKEKFLALGLDEYVPKPIQMDKLFYSIEKMIFLSKGDAEGNNVKITDHEVLIYSEDKEQIKIENYPQIYEDLSREMSELEKTLKQHDILEIENHAKIIKDYFNQLEAYELKSTAFRIELSARRGNYADVFQYAQQLLREFILYDKSFI